MPGLHLWILCLLFAPGLALVVAIKDRFTPLLQLDFGAVIAVLAFLFSLALNIGTLVALSLLGLPFRAALWLLALVVFACAAIIVRRRAWVVPGWASTDRLLWVLVLATAVIMWQNGGLIDLLADSWWHLSLTDEVLRHESIFLDRHHLTGAVLKTSEPVYEPGWHLNLALVALASGAPLPLIWHAIAVWTSIFSVLGYYLLALAVTGNKRIAFMAGLLFVLTLGAINAYLRVSPWPGNVAYIAMYMLLAMTFVGSERLAARDQRPAVSRSVNIFHAPYRLYQLDRPLLLLMIATLALISALHVAELLWFVCALSFYSFVCACLGAGGPRRGEARLWSDGRALHGLWLWFFGALISLYLWKHPDGWKLALMVFCGLAGVYCISRVAARVHRRSAPAALILVLVGVAAALLYLVDFDHLATLFSPRGRAREYYDTYIPSWAGVDLGANLRLPQWEHQLRMGLLFSGLAGVVLSVFLFLSDRSRASVFLLSGAGVSFCILVSPYLFTFLGGVVPITGVYRFQILILHPIVLAQFLYLVYDKSVLPRAGRLSA